MNLPADAKDAIDADWIPGLGRFSGVGNGNLLQFSCLKNSTDREELGGLHSPWGSKESDNEWAHKTSASYVELVHVRISEEFIWWMKQMKRQC